MAMEQSKKKGTMKSNLKISLAIKKSKKVNNKLVINRFENKLIRDKKYSKKFLQSNY